MSKLRLYDNTRLSDWKRCPRYFYWRHVKHLRQEGSAPPLVFGGAYHSALEVIWPHYRDLYSSKKTDILDEAYQAFLAKWVEEGMAHPDQMSPDDLDKLGDRTPMVAYEMLNNYIAAREHIFTDKSFELLSVEEPFIVPLDPNDPTLWYVGRLDKKFRFNRAIHAMEHKTTSMYVKNIRKGGNGYFKANWVEQWSPNSQISGYQFALKQQHGAESGSVWIDGAALGNLPNGFKIIPIEQQDAQLDAWLWEAHIWIDHIEQHKAVLAERSQEDAPYLAAFPKNTNSCIDFQRTCPYLDLCRMYPNPAKLTTVPQGYKEEPWEPFDELKLERVGLAKENVAS